MVGSTQIAVVYVFEDVASFGKWRGDETIDALFAESWQYCENVTSELWGPSPMSPEPLRPS